MAIWPVIGTLQVVWPFAITPVVYNICVLSVRLLVSRRLFSTQASDTIVVRSGLSLGVCLSVGSRLFCCVAVTEIDQHSIGPLIRPFQFMHSTPEGYYQYFDEILLEYVLNKFVLFCILMCCGGWDRTNPVPVQYSGVNLEAQFRKAGHPNEVCFHCLELFGLN